MDIFFHRRRPSTLNDSYLFAVKSYVMMSACSSTEIQGIAVATSARYKFCPVSSSFKGSLFSLHFLCAQKQTKGHLVFKRGPIFRLRQLIVQRVKEMHGNQLHSQQDPYWQKELERILDGVRAFKLGYSEDLRSLG